MNDCRKMSNFAAVTFIIIIIVILLADTPTHAMIIIALIANFMLFAGDKIPGVNFTMSRPAVNAIPLNPVPMVNSEQTPSAHDYASQPVDIYGPYYEQWHAYTKSYDDYPYPEARISQSASELSHNVDQLSAQMTQRRTRDKKCMDGAVTKDKYYYQHHFGSELDDSEAKPWWGRSDY